MYPILSAGLKQMTGVFVTLHKNEKLRGCIGRVLSDDFLFKTVALMAQASAFHDDRFSPLTKDELDDVVIDITVLTQPRKVSSYKDIQAGRHGIILKKIKKDGSVTSAVYLPQVSQMFGGDVEKMLSSLSRKAGLSDDAWREEGIELEVFEGRLF